MIRPSRKSTPSMVVGTESEFRLVMRQIDAVRRRLRMLTLAVAVLALALITIVLRSYGIVTDQQLSEHERKHHVGAAHREAMDLIEVRLKRLELGL